MWNRRYKYSPVTPGYFVSSAQSRRRVTFLQSNVCKRLPEKGNQTRWARPSCQVITLVETRVYPSRRHVISLILSCMKFLQFCQLNTGPKVYPDWWFPLNIHVCFLLFFWIMTVIMILDYIECSGFLYFCSFFQSGQRLTRVRLEAKTCFWKLTTLDHHHLLWAFCGDFTQAWIILTI